MTMQRIIEMLERDDGFLSLGRVMATLTFFLWVGVTIYVLITGKPFVHYGELTGFNAFMVGGVICGKWVDGKNMQLKG